MKNLIVLGQLRTLIFVVVWMLFVLHFALRQVKQSQSNALNASSLDVQLAGTHKSETSV